MPRIKYCFFLQRLNHSINEIKKTKKINILNIMDPAIIQKEEIHIIIIEVNILFIISFSIDTTKFSDYLMIIVNNFVKIICIKIRPHFFFKKNLCIS